MAALTGTTWADHLVSLKKYKGTTTKIQIPHRNVSNHAGASSVGKSVFDAPLVDKDTTPDNDIQRSAPAETLLTPESPASTRQLRQNKRASFMEQFISLYEAGPGEDREEWHTKLRNLYLGMTPERQAELVQNYSKEPKWVDTWCGMVFLSIRKTPNRHLVKNKVRNVKIKHWDLVPTAVYTPCNKCVAQGVVCEYGNLKTTRSCRECRLEGASCQLPRDDPIEDEDEDEMANDEVETDTGTGDPSADKATSSSSQISLSGYRPGRISASQTKFLKIYNSGCEPSKKDQWIKEMFDAYTQMTRRQQEDLADVCKKHDREKWAHILAGMVHVNIRAREERPLIGTTVLNADVSGWDINPTYNEMRCKGCSSGGISCESASQDANLPGCRECLILGRECVDFRRPESASISSRKQTRTSRDETPVTEEQSITETLTSRLRSAKNRINEVKTTPSPNSRATTKRNMLRIPPVTSSSQQEDTRKHRERERISLRLPRTTEAENNIDVPKLKSKRTAIPLDPIPPSDEDNDDERSISMGPPTFNLPVTLTSNGLSLAPGAFQSLSRQPTPAPSFPRTFTAPSLAPAFRSPEPPSKRSRIDLDGRDVRYHTPMPADEPALYHKEDKLIERMEREVERKDRELERKDQELEEMREKLKSERESWLLLQEALEKDKEETMQKTERAKEVVEMEREKERAAWRGASEAWKKEKEALEKDNENWKLKVDEICVERDKLKADIENMQKENDKDEDHLADIERALQEMRARRKSVKDAASTVGDEQRP